MPAGIFPFDAQMFQFYDSTIKRITAAAIVAVLFGFQFYDSTIKSKIISYMKELNQCFNSTIVRLKEITELI